MSPVLSKFLEGRGSLSHLWVRLQALYRNPTQRLGSLLSTLCLYTFILLDRALFCKRRPWSSERLRFFHKVTQKEWKCWEQKLSFLVYNQLGFFFHINYHINPHIFPDETTNNKLCGVVHIIASKLKLISTLWWGVSGGRENLSVLWNPKAREI